ncbi:MAG: glutamine amidotransferase [bacterium]|nr:glutamine amidotransferase [bacterium]
MRCVVIALLVCSACASTLPPTDGDLPTARLEVDRVVHVGFVVVDGVYNTELTAPYDVFHHTVFHAKPGMRVFTVAPSLEPITTFEGLRLLPDYTFDTAPDVNVLVVPSAEHSMDTDLEDEALIGYVRRTGEESAYVVSLCDGAFVLAQAGLLDGLKATTFPDDVDRMREMFPAVDVVHSGQAIHHGKAITSPGGFHSHVPAFYLCDLLYGTDVANGVAHGMVTFWQRGSSHRPVRIVE